MRSGTAQSFLETSSSSSPLLSKLQHDLRSPTASESDPCACQCHGAKGSRGPHRHSKRSRSQTALRTGISELPEWEWDLSSPEPVTKLVKVNRPGESALERLPIEIIGWSGPFDRPST